MIKESLLMFNNGEINKDFMKGKVLFNGSPRVKGCQFGKVIGFYKAGDDNKTHAGLRLFTVEILDSGDQVNWWYDLKDGRINEHLYVVRSEISVKK